MATYDPPSTWDQAVRDGLRKLYEERNRADFVLAVGDAEFKVHKTVLLIHSDVLYTMSTAEGFLESKAGRANLQDVLADHVNAMVSFMYHNSYALRNPKPSTPEEELDGHIEMAKLGQRYLIRPLENYAVQRILEKKLIVKPEYGIRVLYKDDEVPKQVKDLALVEIADRKSRYGTEEGSKLLDEFPAFAVDLVRAIAKRVPRNGCCC